MAFEQPAVRSRLGPALALVLLSPLVAEYLLGDFSLRQIGFLIFLTPQYGGGALFIRELARRRGRRWPTILVLAFAYALVEEGLTTQSLFNPNYAGQRLLDYGYIRALGTSLDWAVFVLTLHVVWSLGCAIAVAESLSGDDWNKPWLRTRGFAFVILLFLAGCVFTAVSTQYIYPFVASPRQFAAIVLLTTAATIAAFSIPKAAPDDGVAPSPAAVGAWTLVLSTAFHVVYDHGQGHGLPPPLVASAMVLLEAIAIVLMVAWSRTSTWTPRHTLAAACGAILTYSWVGLSRMLIRGRTALGVPTTIADTAGQMALVAGVLVLVSVGWRRLRVKPRP